MLRTILTGVLLFGFWVPPLTVGWWVGNNVSRARDPRRSLVPFVLPTALLWSFLWLGAQLVMMPPYVKRGPADPADAPVYAMLGFATMALVIVLPVSAIVCWLAIRQHRQNAASTVKAA